MRKTMFGDTVIDSKDDDLGEALVDAGEEIHAVIREDEDEPGKFYFEIMNNDDGEPVASSDPIFQDEQEARDYLNGFISDIQT